MREEMIRTLAKFFKEKGLMDKVEYRASNSVPYTYRVLLKYFSSYAVMLYEVSQYKLPEEPKPAEVIKPSTVSKKPTRASNKRAKEDSLDE
jgi:hypothetical protein